MRGSFSGRIVCAVSGLGLYPKDDERILQFETGRCSLKSAITAITL